MAEAAKVIENSQRDINIASVNEFAKFFNLMDINTQDVIGGASTKLNFLPFKPGLVDGYCIVVYPYYSVQKAQEYECHLEIILSGRRVNDSMGKYVASEVAKLMIKEDVEVKGVDVLVLGITFKENGPDVRNTKAVDVVNELIDFGTNVTIYDPSASPEEVKKEYNLESQQTVPIKKFDAIILTVSHKEFRDLDLESLKKENSVVYDVKNFLTQRK